MKERGEVGKVHYAFDFQEGLFTSPLSHVVFAHSPVGSENGEAPSAADSILGK